MNILKLNFTAYTLVATLMMTVFMTSCEQDNTIVEDNITNITNDDTQLLQQRFELAKNLSLAIQKPEFASVLKESCTAPRDDGYYETEFFFNLEKDKPNDRLEGKTLDQALTATSGLEVRNNLDFLYTNDPGLAILMIGDENSTDFNNRVYVDNGFDDSDPTSQIQYYENGVLGSHSISEVPDVLTFIVRESEAYLSPDELVYENLADVTKIGNVAGNEINVFGYNSSSPRSLLEELPVEYQNEIESRSCPSCPRNSYGGKENLYAFYTTNDHDAGWNGSGEFIFDILFADNGSGITSLRARYTGVSENSWYTTNRPIITWTSTNDLDRMKYRIMEDDGGATYTVGLSLSGKVNGVTVSGSVQVAYTDDDDFVGETIAEYCDNIRNCGEYYEYAGSVQMSLYQL